MDWTKIWTEHGAEIWIGIVFVFGTVTYLIFPRIYRWWLRRWHLQPDISSGKFNNLIMPLLTVGAITTTFAAFIVQSNFNKFQMEKVTNEKAEKMVFEFINMHNRLENAIEVTENVHGKRAFHFMYYEYMSLKYIMDSTCVLYPELLPVVDTRCEAHVGMNPAQIDSCNRVRQKNELTKIVFWSFIYGIGDNNKALVAAVNFELGGGYDALLDKFRQAVCKVKEQNERRLYYIAMARMNPKYLDRVAGIRDSILAQTLFLNEYFTADERFLYADGHMPNLDSHMRLIKTILTHFNKLKLESSERDYYLDLLRSQLSSHEMLVMALYGFTDRDFCWFKEGFFSDTVEPYNNLLRDIDTGLIRKSVDNWTGYVHSDTMQLRILKERKML